MTILVNIFFAVIIISMACCFVAIMLAMAYRVVSKHCAICAKLCHDNTCDNDEHEIEAKILNWVKDEFLGHSAMILRSQDAPTIKLVTVYGIEDTQVISATRRIWEIICACENHFNGAEHKFAYIPNIQPLKNKESKNNAA